MQRRQGPQAGKQVVRAAVMERLLYWTLFVAGLVLAAWLPAKSMFPQPSAQIMQVLSTFRI